MRHPLRGRPAPLSAGGTESPPRGPKPQAQARSVAGYPSSGPAESVCLSFWLANYACIGSADLKIIRRGTPVRTSMCSMVPLRKASSIEASRRISFETTKSLRSCSGRGASSPSSFKSWRTSVFGPNMGSPSCTSRPLMVPRPSRWHRRTKAWRAADRSDNRSSVMVAPQFDDSRPEEKTAADARSRYPWDSVFSFHATPGGHMFVLSTDSGSALLFLTFLFAHASVHSADGGATRFPSQSLAAFAGTLSAPVPTVHLSSASPGISPTHAAARVH